MKNNNLSGQLLVEVLIAFAVAALALLAITQLSTKSLGNAFYASRQTEAVRYAQAAIETVKDIKKSEGLAAKTNARLTTGGHCYNGSNISTTDANFCQITGTIYESRVTFIWTTVVTAVGDRSELGILAETRWMNNSTYQTVTQQGVVVFEN